MTFLSAKSCSIRITVWGYSSNVARFLISKNCCSSKWDSISPVSRNFLPTFNPHISGIVYSFFVVNIILGTGEYKCEYEILLSCSDATRRVVIPVRTINVPMYDFINSIEDEIEDVMDRSSEENIFSNIIIDTGDYFLLFNPCRISVQKKQKIVFLLLFFLLLFSARYVWRVWSYI